jgi:hypothetical protein
MLRLSLKKMSSIFSTNLLLNNLYFFAKNHALKNNRSLKKQQKQKKKNRALKKQQKQKQKNRALKKQQKQKQQNESKQDYFLNTIGSRAEDDEKKHKLLELFPLRPEEDEKKHQLLELFPLRPSGNSYNLLQHLQSARNDTVCEAVRAVRFSNDIGGSLLPFTECTLCPRECNIMIGSRAEEDEKKHQLLQLFPLRPNGNYKSC